MVSVFSPCYDYKEARRVQSRMASRGELERTLAEEPGPEILVACKQERFSVRRLLRARGDRDWPWTALWLSALLFWPPQNLQLSVSCVPAGTTLELAAFFARLSHLLEL